MGPKEAYDTIRRALADNQRTSIVDCTYDDAAFGNFVIAFEVEGRPSSVVNDRGELALCSDLAGTRQCTTVLRSIDDADEQTVIEALKL
ncbi:MAG TPA: hypothetical protein VKA61_05075 [Sphingomicrobium sp.]|nr:hypothetical protein [Sphingomicrobium sp.]